MFSGNRLSWRQMAEPVGSLNTAQTVCSFVCKVPHQVKGNLPSPFSPNPLPLSPEAGLWCGSHNDILFEGRHGGECVGSQSEELIPRVKVNRQILLRTGFVANRQAALRAAFENPVVVIDLR